MWEMGIANGNRIVREDLTGKVPLAEKPQGGEGLSGPCKGNPGGRHSWGEDPRTGNRHV